LYGAAEKLYGAAEKSYAVVQKFYGAPDFKSATSILQFFNFTILPSATQVRVSVLPP
jgi:hypothetical protein